MRPERVSGPKRGGASEGSLIPFLGFLILVDNPLESEGILSNRGFDRMPRGRGNHSDGDIIHGGHRRTTMAGYRAFFRGPLYLFSTPNPVMSDFAGLVGVSRSTSHYPIDDPERSGKIEAALREIFEKYQKTDGQVAVNYLATIYAGRLAG